MAPGRPAQREGGLAMLRGASHVSGGTQPCGRQINSTGPTHTTATGQALLGG